MNITCSEGLKGASGTTKTAAELYYNYEVLNISSGFGDFGEINLSLLALMIVIWVVVYLCVWRSLVQARYVRFYIKFFFECH